eukprot:gb/GEZN01003235.1/.p1 GENE.gb/GEZN01003235.1/~~gb/GEZN01003235.1/.p1  ORF type:complete len:527 (-),score=32.81 gb/GEZN01003235.1/:622-2202(-)
MSSFHYVSLEEAHDTGSLPVPLHALIGVGLFLTSAFGVATTHMFQTEKRNEQLEAFLPRNTSLKQLAMGHGTSSTVIKEAPHCIFLYAGWAEQLQNIERAHVAAKAWVYGACFNANNSAADANNPSADTNVVASPTGSPGDVVKGVVLCWLGASSISFPDKLTLADKIHGYSATKGGPVRRGVVSAVRVDGTLCSAYWYFAALASEQEQDVTKPATKLRSLDCPMCNRTFSNSGNLRQHVRKHNKEQFTCPECHRNFSSKSHLVRHAAVHTGNLYYCNHSQCDKSYTSPDNLRRHMRSHDIDLNRGFCPECNRSFMKENLKRHMKLHSDQRPFCLQCNRSFPEEKSLQRHTKTHNRQPIPCDVCGAEFRDLAKMMRHRRTHTGDKPYVCDECGQRFARTDVLLTHKRLHTGERPYWCEECNQSFTRSNNFRNHKATHVKKHLCRKCNMSFTRMSDLTRHMRTHSGENHLQCLHCNMTFASKYGAQRHVLRAHSSAEQRPHVCQECGKSFAEGSELRVHERSHLPTD